MGTTSLTGEAGPIRYDRISYNDDISLLLLVSLLYLFFEVRVDLILHLLYLAAQEPLDHQGRVVLLPDVLLFLLFLGGQDLQEHADDRVELGHTLPLRAPVFHYLVGQRHEHLFAQGFHDVLHEVDEGVGVEVVGLE